MAEQSNTNSVLDSPQIAICGNPNTGKSSLFNRLTGLRQHVGNYPGVTVEKKTGEMEIAGRLLTITDLPGTYSLTASSPDEAVVSEVLFGRSEGVRRPDLIICVVDSTSLVSSLFLSAQISDLGIPMVLALNMWDEALEKGIHIDINLLSERLGIPCVPTSARTGAGVDDLRAAVLKVLMDKRCMKAPDWPQSVISATEVLRQGLGDCDYSDAAIRRILFDGAGLVAKSLGCSEARRHAPVAAARKVLFDAGINPMACESVQHYKNLRALTAGVFGGESERASHPHSESIDRLLLHRGWGLLIFVAVMYMMFQAVYSWSSPFMAGIDWLVERFQVLVGGMLVGNEILQSLIVDGIIGGVGACLVFIPQILILFMFIAVLEDSGYLPRAAFLMDKMFSWCGLSGRSFVPMLSSYACAVPGVMATRTIKDPKARIATILVAPLMSCSARLPVYVLFIGLFIEPRYGSFYAGLALFGMHIVGLMVAGPVAFILTRFVLHSHPQPFLLELPPYRVPRVSDVALRMYERGKMFVEKAGTVIFAMTVIVWALLYFPRAPELEKRVMDGFPARYAAETGMSEPDVAAALAREDWVICEARQHAVDAACIEQSYLGRFGKAIQPVFNPCGFDWKLSVAIASSLPAREVVLSTMGIIYNLGADVDDQAGALRERMMSERWTSGGREGQQVYTLPMVLAIMVFFALCQQCAATLAVIVREAGWKWAVFSFTYMTTLAWIGATLVYQIGSLW